MSDYLIVGLGNPGSKYRLTRHNAGFMVVDELAERLGTTFREVKTAPARQEAEARLDGKRMMLLKPMTYMNRSGDAVARLVKYFKIPLDNLLVIQDDLDMEPGRIKLVRSGGAGGHNGIRSIIASIGSKEFPRLKIGIGRPDGPMPVDRYVLSRFGADELSLYDQVVKEAAGAAECFVERGLQEAMNRYNGKKIA